MRKGIVGSFTLESISTAVLVFLHVITTRRMRSSVHICSRFCVNLRVTHMGWDQMSRGVVSRISTIQSTYHFMNASGSFPGSYSRENALMRLPLASRTVQESVNT